MSRARVRRPAVATALVATVLTAAAMAGAGAVAGCSPGGEEGLRVGLAYDIGGRGDRAFNDAAAAGLDRVRRELAGSLGDVRELTARVRESEKDKYDRLKLLCEAGFGVVIAVGYEYAGVDAADGPLARAARECPETRFAIVDDARVSAPNVVSLVFAEEQGSFLVGVVAGRRTRTGRVGFVGGCENALIRKFAAGFRAGVAAVRPSAPVDVRYLHGDKLPCPGFTAAAQAREVAGQLYDGGADIVYHAAGGSGLGVFEAARDRGRLAIGVDTDQYATVGEELRRVVLTSMVKRVDTAVFTVVSEVVHGRFAPGQRRFDLSVGGVGYATSGGRINDLVPELEAYKKKIIDGSVIVPTNP
ncbi:MAG TPA: BMP family ABC transporter substrate-binding protein [Micromonosporaceae bacterium]|nr:BMP family ABC transporter substrate-binding protein [Micromonosporaceae bacterium]